jgi:hypothetical protein
MGNADKRYEVIISDKASEMLLTHVRFLAQVSEEAAQEVAGRFTSSARSLEYFPERNPWLTDISLPINKYRKLLFSKRHLIIYQIKDNKVYIDYIVDCRQDYAWLL